VPEKHISLSEKIDISYKQLAATAISLNDSFEELAMSIEEIDGALRASNLGINLAAPVWILIPQRDDAQTSYWRRELGYDRIENRWGITIRARSLGSANGNQNKCEVWFFSEAPRHLQLEAAEKLPDLFEKLIRQSEAVAARIRGRFPLSPLTAALSPEKPRTLCTVCLAA
jgi:hypothetical protein